MTSGLFPQDSRSGHKLCLLSTAREWFATPQPERCPLPRAPKHAVVRNPCARAGLAPLDSDHAPLTHPPGTLSQETPGKAQNTCNLLVEEQLAEGCCLQSSLGPCLQEVVHRDPMMAQTGVG